MVAQQQQQHYARDVTTARGTGRRTTTRFRAATATMPTYLCHGFRWHRRDIRIFVIVNNLDDAAPDWLVGRTSSAQILGQFANAFDFLPKQPPAPQPTAAPAEGSSAALHRDDDFSAPPPRVPACDDNVLANEWSPVKLLEEYDAEETASAARPYAYVADYAVRVDLGASVAEEMAKYEAMAKQRGGSWFEKLRDQLQAGAAIQWYVVVCADEERAAPGEDLDDESSDEGPPTPTRELSMRQFLQTTSAATDWPPTGSVRSRDGAKSKPDDGRQPEFLSEDPFKASPQQGLRHKLSTKGLRRLLVAPRAGPAAAADTHCAWQPSPYSAPSHNHPDRRAAPAARMSSRPASPLAPGQASPSFAQTGAEFTLDDSDEPGEGEGDGDLRSEVGGSEAHELVSGRDASRERADGRVDEALMGSVASLQLYTPDEDLAVRRKFDRKLVLFVALLYMLSFLDRSNIGNARIAGMDADLQTDPPRDDWYEWALAAFYAAYIAFEWMSLLWKLVPAHAFVSAMVLAWGLAASLQAVAASYPVLVALRVVLGVAEAGFAGIPVYLSFFFRREELAFRTAIFISAAPLATSFASTLAWAVVGFAGLGPIAPWRLLFLVEGFPSVVVAVVAWSAIPDSPQTAPYLTRREKKVARLRLRGEHSSRAAKPASGLRARDLAAVFCDPVAWATAAMFFLTNMAYSSLPVFLPKIIADMGHDALAAQALSAPPYLVAFVVVLFTAHMSDRLRARAVPIVLHALASAAGYAALALSETLRLPPSLRYAAVYPAAVGFFNVVTLIIAWSINNQASQTRQGGGFALLQLVGQCGPLVGTRLYPDREAPYYSRGMQACACAMFSVAVLALVLRMYLQYRNRGMDRAEQQRAADGTTAEQEELVGPGKRKTAPTDGFRYML
ncbi:Uncharacterized protein TPAR_00457 [Tolypocladium paradoxum]|uniref:Transporter n=1 Tax=Tolypocladium paradoxum TaxID=94208 RepID=A0A2S4LA90_9HYPO|nr:Uncharacterized protein TPAR_00457 [Tolypocladium paradoxum]